MCNRDMYRKVELYDGIIIAPLKIVKGTGMSVHGGLGINRAFLPEKMNEDQQYRRKYRNALIEINTIIQPFKGTMDIFKEIGKIMERCDI